MEEGRLAHEDLQSPMHSIDDRESPKKWRFKLWGSGGKAIMVDPDPVFPRSGGHNAYASRFAPQFVSFFLFLSDPSVWLSWNK